MIFAWAGKRENRKLLLNQYRVSVYKDKVLEINGDDGFITT